MNFNIWIEIWQRLLEVSSSSLNNVILVVTAFIFLAELLLISRQLRLTNKSSQAQFGIDIMKELRTEDWRNKFNEIYQAKDDELKTDEKIVQNAEFALDKFEWVGVMLNEHIFSIDIVMKLVGGLPIRVWYKLDKVGFIKDKREQRGHYARYAEYFTKKSIEYQIEYQPMEEWTKLNENKDVLNELIKKKLISLKELRRLNFWRQFHALTNKKLNYGYPLEGLEEALEKNDIIEIKENLSEIKIQFDDKPIIILNHSKLFNNTLILKLSKDHRILEQCKNEQVSKLCNNKWISKLCKNKLKIIAGEREYVIVKADDKMYYCKGYEMWYRNIVKSIKEIS